MKNRVITAMVSYKFNPFSSSTKLCWVFLFRFFSASIIYDYGMLCVFFILLPLANLFRTLISRVFRKSFTVRQERYENGANTFEKCSVFLLLYRFVSLSNQQPSVFQTFFSSQVQLLETCLTRFFTIHQLNFRFKHNLIGIIML